MSKRTVLDDIERRNDYGDYINILKKLEEEQNDEPEFFAPPRDIYRVKKGDKVSVDEENNIITEESNVDNYRDKLEKTKEIIKIFSQYGSRNADTNAVLDKKVYFREIYLSNSKFKRQAKTIVSKYLENIQEEKDMGYSTKINSFGKESEYRFFREKISRGYFRETCDIRLYSVKNKLQKHLYEVILDTLLIYDYKIPIEYLQQIVRGLIPICFKHIDNLLETVYGYRIF